MVGGGDCLSAESTSFAAGRFGEAAQEISGGVAFSLVSFGAKLAVKQRALGGHNLYGHWLSKRKKLGSRATATSYRLKL